jgi:hypothetical protein
VLLGLLVHDKHSFLYHGWAPDGNDFTFAQLLDIAEKWIDGN